MAGPAPILECPKCRHSNPSGSLQCAKCSSPLSSEDLTVTEVMDGDNWSIVTPAGAETALPGLTPGRVIAGRYEIPKLLGEGGMGAIFQAMDRQLERPAALKVIRPELAANPTILRTARPFTRNNLVRVFEV